MDLVLHFTPVSTFSMLAIILTPCIAFTWNENAHSLPRSLVILFWLQVLVLCSYTANWNLFFCQLQILSERGKKKNLKFLLVTSDVDDSFSIAGSKPRGPSSGCLVPSQKSDLSMHVSSGKHTESLQMVPVLSYLIFKMFVLYLPPPRGRKNQKW